MTVSQRPPRVRYPHVVEDAVLATRHPLRRSPILIAALAVAALTAAAQPARAAEAFFPDLAPATQISRDLTLQQAAQSGLISLQSKGGGVGRFNSCTQRSTFAGVDFVIQNLIHQWRDIAAQKFARTIG